MNGNVASSAGHVSGERRPSAGPHLPIGLLLVGVLLVVLIGLGSLYWATQRMVSIEINGVAFPHRTHQTTTGGVLREMGIVLQEQDVLTAPSSAELRQGVPIIIAAARQIRVIHDGAVSQAATQASDVRAAFAAVDLLMQPYDQLSLAGKEVALDAALPPPDVRAAGEARRWLMEIRRPLSFTLRRAVAFGLRDGELHTVLYTTAQSVGEALYDQGIAIYAGDRVFPGMESSLTPGLTVLIERSRPVRLEVGGQPKLLRTRSDTVGDLLAAEAVTLGPKDYVLPDPREAVTRALLVRVVRVEDAYYVEEVPIAFQTRYEPDPEMEIDLSEVAVWGLEGAHRRRMRVRYENGYEIYRAEEEEWIAREPQDRIISYGTNIVLRALETPEGTFTYWRKIRMLATSYNAATAGTPRSASYYGYTRLGEKARKGIIAVDPRVISLRQGMYVPGYGAGYAGDTGGAIQWRRIDLCYDDDNLVLWRRWVDVYLLAPVPAPSEILWMIPNTPAERG